MSTKNLGAERAVMSISDAINGFLFHCQFEKNLNDKTLRAYKIDLNQFALHAKKTTKEDDIKLLGKETLKSYLQEISDFKPKTVKRKIASLKAMLNHLEYEDENFINPFRRLKVRLKEPQILPSVMTLDEVKKILHFLYQERDGNTKTTDYTYRTQTRNIAIVEVLFSTGMRVSEVCNMKLEDINLKNGSIKILGKGSKERIIQICNAETLSIIKSYYNMHKSKIVQGQTFFINRLGASLSTQSVRLMIKSYVKKVGLSKNITPHTFRHTFATLLLEEDVDIKYIQSMLGHSSIAITQIYTHVNMGKQKKILSTKHPRKKLKFNGNN